MKFLSNFSNRELNLWATLVLDVGVTVYYFSQVLGMPGGLDANLVELAKLVGKIIIFAIIFGIIVFSIINARGQEQLDERDYRFEAKANSIGHGTLVICAVLIIGHIVLNTLGLNYWPSNQKFLLSVSPMAIAHLLLLALILTSSVKAISQLILYRRDMV